MERELGDVLGLLLAWNRPSLGNLHTHELANALIRKLVPHVIDIFRRVIVVMLTRIVVTVHAHGIEKTIVDGAEIDDIEILIHIINKWQEVLPLQTIEIKILRWTIRGNQDDDAVRIKRIKEPLKYHGIGNVEHLELVDAEHEDFAGEFVADKRYGITFLALQLLIDFVLPLMHLEHELLVVEEDATCVLQVQALEQGLKNERLAAAGITPQINALNTVKRGIACIQLLVRFRSQIFFFVGQVDELLLIFL